MERIEYTVVQIDGDYVHLKQIGTESTELKLVARALLSPDIYEGCELIYECFEYTLKGE